MINEDYEVLMNGILAIAELRFAEFFVCESCIKQTHRHCGEVNE